jgi:hypothetical protein
MAGPATSFIQYLVSKTVGPEKIGLLRYNNDAKADKKMEVLATPIAVIGGSTATAGFCVGQGNLCRVFGTSGTSLVQFGSGSNPVASVPTGLTQTAAMMSASTQTFVATGDWIRTTAEVTRVEIYED